MILFIDERIWREIVNHLENVYPEEGCGLLLGVIEENYLVNNLYPMENVWENKGERKNRYALSPIEWLKAERRADAENLLILGIYHSHPDYPPYLSSFDLERAWEGYVYLIVRISQGKADQSRAYLITHYKKVQAIPIQIVREVQP